MSWGKSACSFCRQVVETELKAIWPLRYVGSSTQTVYGREVAKEHPLPGIPGMCPGEGKPTLW